MTNFYFLAHSFAKPCETRRLSVSMDNETLRELLIACASLPVTKSDADILFAEDEAERWGIDATEKPHAIARVALSRNGFRFQLHDDVEWRSRFLPFSVLTDALKSGDMHWLSNVDGGIEHDVECLPLGNEVVSLRALPKSYENYDGNESVFAMQVYRDLHRVHEVAQYISSALRKLAPHNAFPASWATLDSTARRWDISHTEQATHHVANTDDMRVSRAQLQQLLGSLSAFVDSDVVVRDDSIVTEREALVRELNAFELAHGVHRDGDEVTLQQSDWKVVLSDGLEAGHYWRPEICVHDIGEHDDDGFYYYDTNNSSEPMSGPFATFDALLADVFKDNSVAEWRLVGHCGLSAAKARAVIAAVAEFEQLEQRVADAQSALSP